VHRNSDFFHDDRPPVSIFKSSIFNGSEVLEAIVCISIRNFIKSGQNAAEKSHFFDLRNFTLFELSSTKICRRI